MSRLGYDDTGDRLGALIDHPRSIARFVAASQTKPVLALFPNPREAMQQLLAMKVAREEFAGRGADALLRAIIALYQTTPVDLWPAMLVVAFWPALLRLRDTMLWSLRKRGRANTYEAEELREIALDAFLTGARSLRNIDDVTIIPVRLTTEMKRRAFDAVNRPHRERVLIHGLVTEALDRRKIEPFAGSRAEASPHGHAADDELGIEEMLEELLAAAPEAIAVLNEKQPSLRRLTQVLRADLTPVEQERLYQTIKRRRLRARAAGADASTLAPWWHALLRTKPEDRSTPKGGVERLRSNENQTNEKGDAG